jgi:hypothetical protein
MVGFQVVTPEIMKSSVVWNIMMRSPLKMPITVAAQSKA